MDNFDDNWKSSETWSRLYRCHFQQLTFPTFLTFPDLTEYVHLHVHKKKKPNMN